MDRKDFIRKGIWGTGIIAASVSGLKALANSIDELEPLEAMSLDAILGFNHIENKKSEIMENVVLHKADSRGDANHGWLHSKHTFSFANYYNPDRMHFGVLRVLNDDSVAAGMGFGKHPHDNMEIISIPLQGDLEHKDSMGNTTVIKHGDIQIMSAGTGVQHSEYNASKTDPVKFLQIWVFPNQQNVKPRYDQITLDVANRKNKLQQIVSPNAEDAGVWIHQDAWFHLGDLDAGFKTDYKVKKDGNGVYIFVLNGTVKVNGVDLETRDGMGIWATATLDIEASTAAEVLLMEVPMALA
jgi:redox-sensitive bicupin YhaK (pirin superfamily)